MRAFFRGVAEEDLRTHRPQDLAAAALAHLEFGRQRKGSQVLVQLAPALNAAAPTASHRALVRLVAPDMPFLVDSIGIVFSQMNIGVHLIVHPVLGVRRDARGGLKSVSTEPGETRPESWQMIEIDQPRDAAQARELARRLHATLEDVRRAVADFPAMLERVRTVANELGQASLPVLKSSSSAARALLSWMHDGRLPRLSLLPLEARPFARRAVRDAGSGLGILRENASRKTPAPSCSPGTCAAERAPDLWC